MTTNQDLSAYAPSRMFPPSALAIVHKFFADAAGTRSIIPMLPGAGTSNGGVYLPEPDIDLVVAWPLSVTRQAARIQSSLSGRHMILMTMKSPIVADQCRLTLVFNDSRVISFIDHLGIYTNDGGTFWLAPTNEGLLHFQLRRDGLFPKLSPPWRDERQQRAGFRRAADLLTDRLLGQAR